MIAVATSPPTRMVMAGISAEALMPREIELRTPTATTTQVRTLRQEAIIRSV